jgi:hypothetical protein
MRVLSCGFGSSCKVVSYRYVDEMRRGRLRFVGEMGNGTLGEGHTDNAPLLPGDDCLYKLCETKSDFAGPSCLVMIACRSYETKSDCRTFQDGRCAASAYEARTV